MITFCLQVFLFVTLYMHWKTIRNAVFPHIFQFRLHCAVIRFIFFLFILLSSFVRYIVLYAVCCGCGCVINFPFYKWNKIVENETKLKGHEKKQRKNIYKYLYQGIAPNNSDEPTKRRMLNKHNSKQTKFQMSTNVTRCFLEFGHN